MTADIELLPSSVAAFTEALKGERGSLDAWLEVNDEREVAAHVEAYTRANVAHATAAKDAEIEALVHDLEQTRANVVAEHEARIEAEAQAKRLAETLHKLEDSCEDSDGARLDWLADQMRIADLHFILDSVPLDPSDLRAAIDAAREARND